nr:SDR family NAD(P)-dependent oxidoreductase [Halorubrum sp. BOL3-1]
MGREVPLGLADAGADVAVHYRESEAAAVETAEAAREFGVEATTIQGDITVPEAVDEMISECEAALGSVDVLVNAVDPSPVERGTNSRSKTGRGQLRGVCTEHISACVESFR